jgi:hypothetical protein
MSTTNMNMNYEMAQVCYVKAVYSMDRHKYMLSPSLSVRDFIATVQKRAAEDIYHLSLSSNETEINTIEVVEAGQELENIRAEDAPKMEPEDITMRQKYGSALDHVSFYVRSALLDPIR